MRAVRCWFDTDWVRPTYDQEVAALATSYADIRGWEAARWQSILARLCFGPAAFIASGGMVAVARLGAQLHEQRARQPGVALTPLEAVSRPAIAESGAVLLTSSGKHPDAVEVMRRLGRLGLRPATVLTHRASELLDVADATVVTLPALPVREGFLAVNSVMSMAAALIRGYCGDILPEYLGRPLVPDWPDEVDRLLVLYSPQLGSVAADVETRAAEVGLAAVQTADFRNFAHGRHTGLERGLDRTTIVVLSEPESAPLAEATLSALPSHAKLVRWHSDAPWPLGVLELLAVSIEACGNLGAREGVSLSRPKVPAFGRRLYRLPIRRRLPNVLAGPVERKLIVFGAGPSAAQIRSAYRDAFSSWRDELRSIRFSTLVLDYDGTVCATERRFDPPDGPIVAALSRLLAAGLRLGFASGRGPSLQRDLRNVIAPEHWERVELGLYNGGVLCRLDEELGDIRTPSALIEEATDRIASLPIAAALSLEGRCAQLTVASRHGAWVSPAMLFELVRTALARPPALPVKVVGSGHSLDIVASDTSKVAVVERLRAILGPAPILCIGDQGQAGGNDYELLAHDPWSLSVDRCSADPSRCWYLGDGSVAGPALLLRYLNALRERKDGLVLDQSGIL
jgi:hypothetical protein